MTDITEIKGLVVAQGEAYKAASTRVDERISKLEESNNALEKFVARQTSPFAPSSKQSDPGESPAFMVKQRDGTLLPVLRKSARLSAQYRDDRIGFGADSEDDFSIGNYVQDFMLGRKAASNSALVPVGVSASVIDNIRAATTIIQAGSGTIIVDGPTNVARITGDPVVHEHAESADDIDESDITVLPVTLNPKALVALIPLSMEVVSDSQNLDAVLNASIAAAFASKLDALSLATILADGAVPTSIAGQDPAKWLECLAAIAAAMGVNQPLPSSMIGSAADFIARASQQASTGGQWLGKPPALAGLTEYPTTNISAGTAIYGGFDRAFALALRQELRLEIVRFAKPGSASHLLVAHMRAAGVVLQPKALFIQKKTV